MAVEIPNASPLELAKFQAELNGHIVIEQQKEMQTLRYRIAVLRASLASIYGNCSKLSGREAIEALIDRGYLKREDVL